MVLGKFEIVEFIRQLKIIKMYNSLLSIAINASIKAGEEILKVYGTKFDVEIKGDNSPLTKADKNANDIINDFLVPTNIPIISEENKQLPFSQRGGWEQCWIVDPLDGTKEFIKRNGEFTVNIALVKNGIPLLGIIYVPVSKTLYFTEADCNGSKKIVLKSELVSMEEIYNQAKSIQPDITSEVVRIVGSRSHLNQDTEDFIKEIEKENKVEVVSKGSSLKFCLVAEGLADLYPRFAPTMEWDTAAGDAICRAVGLEVVDQVTKQPLEYNKENLLNNYFLVRGKC